MDCYLLIDFGSTYTKLTLVDINNKGIVARANDYTTIETSIIAGYKKAYGKLLNKLSQDGISENELNIKDTLACSSAAGGLKMIAVGVTPEYTTKAAKSAALGAGARLLKVYSYLLTDKDLDEIIELKPDIILLAGGAEGGNTRYITENSKLLASKKLDFPIVIAGNSYANEKIDDIFRDTKNEYYITENVMPDINRINPTAVREKIREIFMKNIVFAKGMDDVQSITNDILMPTPSAVLKAAELLSLGTENIQGIGNLMIVDVGGATTDVHTISEGFDKNFGYRYEGLEEPFIKRTVEGDLGMRYSAISLFENLKENNFYNNTSKPTLDISEDILYNSCLMRMENPIMIPKSSEEVKIDSFIARQCINISINRHSGTCRKSYMNGRNIIIQKGKDLRNIKTIIGTGGVIINSNNPQDILKIENNFKDNNILSPRNPGYYIDKNYLLSAMGLLSTVDPDLAISIMLNNLEELK